MIFRNRLRCLRSLIVNTITARWNASDRQFSIPGFLMYRNDRKKGGGGVMVYISSKLTCKRLKLEKSYKTIESIAVEIRIANRNMLILGIYRPPKVLSGDYQTLLENELSDVCNWANLKNNFVTLLGDLNLDRLKPNTSEGKLLLNLEVEQGFECLITQPTRIATSGTKTTSTLIDVLLSNRPDLFKHSGIYHPSLSDHCLIYGILRDKVVSHQSKVITFRSYKNFDECRFKESLLMAPWHVGEIFDEIDDQAYYWSTLLQNVVDEHLPLKKMRVRDKDVPYMTTGWKQAIRAKRRATAKYKNNPTRENWESKKKCRNEATRQRRLAIKEHWRKKADDLFNAAMQMAY